MPVFASIIRGKEGLHQFHGDGFADHSPAQNKHIDVIMLNALMRRVMIVAKARTDAGNFVGRDRRANAAATHEDTALRFAVPNRDAHGFRKIRVMHRLSAFRSQIKHLVFKFRKQSLQAFLQGKAGVIRSQGNFHATFLRHSP